MNNKIKEMSIVPITRKKIWVKISFFVVKTSIISL